MKSFTVIDFGHGKRVSENVDCRIRKENIRNSGKNREPKQHFFMRSDLENVFVGYTI